MRERVTVVMVLRAILLSSVLLLIPLLAEQFSSAVNWQLNDYLLAFCILFSAGLIAQWCYIRWPQRRRYSGALIALLTLLVWVGLAVF
ncbi:MAG: hypothetical protein HWE11_05085 [Gammaproteobacteria bacterium]|nr:hypothetical protein [Gammaproteobacteria bacterium]